ncbi:anti-sigma factor [Streptomyces sp. KR80]|uniref:anti-sigma factor n=1 Tax=Streptomyces sp. KR80 TaxID=3457426 RepID=UPI003FD22232
MTEQPDRGSDRDREPDRPRGNGPACAELRDMGAELALGVLPARERARAIAHLDRCPACREHIGGLARVGDGLLGLLPGSEPPVGFEKRVMNRLNLSAPQDRQTGRRGRGRLRPRLVAAAAALAIAGGFGGWAVGNALDEPVPTTTASRTALSAADFVAGDHRVGQIFAHPGSPGWVYMSVDLYTGGEKISCLLERTDGSTVTVGSFTLRDGYGYWGAPADVDPGTLSAARLVAADGSVLATARFDADRR